MKKVIGCLAAFIILFSCGSNSQSDNAMEKDKGNFDLQGHRGCRGLMPENTIPAMIHALELGVTTLEMDASITADNQVILSHEPFFNHKISLHPDGKPVTEDEERSLNIFRMPYNEVKAFDVGMRAHPRFPEQKKMAATKPLLREVIEAVKQWCQENNQPLPFFNIETKCLPVGDNIYHPGPDRFVDLLVSELKNGGILSKTIIQSFDFRTLQYARKQYPEITLAALVEEDDPGNIATHLEALGFVPEIYSPAHQRVDKDLVHECNLRGMKLIPWTVNDSARAAGLKALGVDGLITDYPDRIK